MSPMKMRKFGKLIGFLVVVCTAIVIIKMLTIRNLSSETVPEKAEADMRISQIETIINLLEQCPPWLELRRPQPYDFGSHSGEDERTANEIVRIMSQLSSYPTDVLREAIKRYISEASTSPLDTKNSKVHVLNRYLFDVPRHGKTFPLYPSDPPGRSSISPMWPLDFDKEGNLVLTGRMMPTPMTGCSPSTSGLDEFDRFAKQYKRRTVRDNP